MLAHSIGSGTISFGLVAIPIRLYTAAVSAGVSFHLLHATCGHRGEPAGDRPRRGPRRRHAVRRAPEGRRHCLLA